MTSFVGHIDHIYDNSSLTLQEIEQIFLDVAGGTILAEEKVDGWNLYWSADTNGKIRLARNKQDLAAGGLTLEDIQRKEFSSPLVRDTYVKIVSELQKAVNGIQPIVRNRIFDGVFFNADVIGEHTKRIIPYSRNVISVHRTGHIANKIVNDKHLTALTTEMAKKSGLDFEITLTPTIKFSKPNLDFTNLREAFCGKQNLTISDVMRDWLFEILEVLPERTRSLVAARLLREPGFMKVNEICNSVSSDQHDNIRKIIKNETKYLNLALREVKTAIVELENRLLEGTNSHFVTDFGVGLGSIKSQYVDLVAKMRQNTSFKHEIDEFLTEHRAEACEPVTTLEGIVFESGKTYKMTGNFADLNQIVGLYEFGQGSIPSFKKKQYDLVIYPGSFTPPHRGHIEVVQKCVSMSERMLIVKSSKSRHASDGREVTNETSIKLFKYLLRSLALEGKVEIKPCETDSPVQDVYRYLGESVPAGSKVLIVCGNKAKDAERYSTISKYVKNGVQVEILNVEPITEASLGVLSSTKMRDAIGDITELKKYLPKEVQGEAFKVQNILMNKLTDDDIRSVVSEIIKKHGNEWCLKPAPTKKQAITEDLYGFEVRWRVVGKKGEVAGTYKNKVRANRVKDEKDNEYGAYHYQIVPVVFKNGAFYSDDPEKARDLLKRIAGVTESTSMGAGAVQGSTKPKRKKHKQLAVEMQLHELYQTLNEADDSDIPRSSTAINVLADLLKQILDQIKDGYKDLTTSHDQRLSYKAHLINAIENSLTAEEVNEEIDVSVQGKDLDHLTKVTNDDIPELIDVDDDGAAETPDDEKKKFARGLEKHQLDLTGRNMAYDVFNSVETSIKDAYNVLGNDDDQKEFVQYLMTNIKLYCDQWEQELAVVA